MASVNDRVVLVDVDNTLLDNDTVVRDLKHHLRAAIGADGERRYWELFDALWKEVGYADYLGAFQRLRLERPLDLEVPRASMFLLNYPFGDRLYPGALDAVAEIGRQAPIVILSDGDTVHQPHKIDRSGLWGALNGRVLIYVHKELMLDDVETRYPARHYVMVDDKLRVLAAVKSVWADRVTTVFVRQGHYALDPDVIAAYPAADVTIERIADLPQVM